MSTNFVYEKENGHKLKVVDSRILCGAYVITCIDPRSGIVSNKKREDLIYSNDVESIAYLQNNCDSKLTEKGKKFYSKKMENICNRLKLNPIEILNLDISKYIF